MPLKEKIKEISLKVAKPFILIVEKIHLTITVLAIMSSLFLIIPQMYRLLDNVGPEKWPLIPGIIGGITFLTAIYILWKRT